MIEALLDVLFSVCVLAWLAWFAIAVLIVFSMGWLLSQEALQKLRSWVTRVWQREYRQESDGRFLRAAGIKR